MYDAIIDVVISKAGDMLNPNWKVLTSGANTLNYRDKYTYVMYWLAALLTVSNMREGCFPSCSHRRHILHSAATALT